MRSEQGNYGSIWWAASAPTQCLLHHLPWLLCCIDCGSVMLIIKTVLYMATMAFSFYTYRFLQQPQIHKTGPPNSNAVGHAMCRLSSLERTETY